MNTHILAVGINHKTATIEIREQFALNPIQQELLLNQLKNLPDVIEAFVLSTCNRVEIYAHVLENEWSVDSLIEQVFVVKNIPFSFKLKDHFYVYRDAQAVEHLFRVTAGLDSQVLGERQILGQVKEAVQLAQKSGMFQQTFNTLTQTAVRCGKKARTETDINFGGSSISWAAVAMAEQVLGSLTDRNVLVIGGGKMGEMAVEYIQKKRVGNLYLMNRTPCVALDLANQYNARAVSFCDIKEILTQIDCCICSTGAPHYILERETIEKIMAVRSEAPLVLIDISVPRNINPDTEQVNRVFLYSIDDLSAVIDDSLRRRESAIPEVEKIILKQISGYFRKIHKLKFYSDVFLSVHSLNP